MIVHDYKENAPGWRVVICGLPRVYLKCMASIESRINAYCVEVDSVGETLQGFLRKGDGGWSILRKNRGSQEDWIMNQRNTGSLIAGAALIALGGLFLLNQFLHISIWRFLWPLFVLLPGVGMFAGVYSGGKQSAGLAVPASVVTAVGLILLFQSVTDHWESWAYAWALIFPTAVGLGMYIYGARGEDGDRAGREDVRLSAPWPRPPPPSRCGLRWPRPPPSRC